MVRGRRRKGTMAVPHAVRWRSWSARFMDDLAVVCVPVATKVSRIKKPVIERGSRSIIATVKFGCLRHSPAFFQSGQTHTG